MSVTKSDSGFLLGTVFLILAQIMVGINIVSSKHLLVLEPVLFLLAMRFALAAIILFPLHWLIGPKQHKLSYYFAQLNQKDWIFIIAQALCAGVLFNFLMLLGLEYTDANLAGIITSVLPAIIALMSWMVLKEPFSQRIGVCIFFATAGLLVIAWDKFHSETIHHSLRGDALVLLSLLPEATYYVLCKLHPNRLPVFLISSLMNAINAVIALCVLKCIPMQIAFLSLYNALILFILGLSSGLFYVFWYFGYHRVDGMMASLSTAIMPVATVIFAWVFLSEQLTAYQIIGMALVLLSIVSYARR